MPAGRGRWRAPLLRRLARRRRAVKPRPPLPDSGSGARRWGLLAHLGLRAWVVLAICRGLGRNRRLGKGQVVQRLQPEHLKEPHGGAEEPRLTGPSSTANLL